jgi:hypothetical protein
MTEEEARKSEDGYKNQQDATDFIRELILDYETEKEPFLFMAGGFSIWPIFRIPILQSLLTSLQICDLSRDRTSSKIKTLARLARNFPEQPVNLLQQYRLRGQGILGCSLLDLLRDKVNGKRYDSYFDFILPYLPSFSMCRNGMIRHSSDQSYSIISDELKIPYYRLGRIKHRKEASWVQQAVIADFAQWLRSRDFNLWSLLPQDICDTNSVAYFLSDMDFYTALLRIRRPRLLVVVGSALWVPMVAAAHSLGIPVWELQHGMISKYNFDYNYSESALPYREFLPLPEKILTFGPYFSQLLVSCGYWRKEDVPTLGFGRLNYFKGKVNGMQRVDRGTHKLSVMISTDWSQDDENIVFIKELRRVIPPGVKLLINPHPNTPGKTVSRYNALLDGSIEVMDPADSLYNRLDVLDIHCACSSTTLFESVAMGIPTVVIGLPGWKNAEVLVNRGASLFAGSPKELAQIFRSASEDSAFLGKWREETKTSGSYFFESFTAKRAEELFSWTGGVRTSRSRTG